METKVDIYFYPRTSKKNKKGLTPIYARIIVNSNRLDFSTGFSIDHTHWNTQAGKVNGNTQEAQLINNYMNIKKVELSKAYNELLFEQGTITIGALRDKILGIREEENHKTLIQLVDFHNSIFKSKIGTDAVLATYAKYKVTRKRLIQFIEHQYKKQDFKLKDLKLEFIASFDLYLKTKFKNSHNTVVKHCKNLKAIINLGIQYEWIEKNPFTRHKAPYKEGDKSILSKQELAALESKEIKISRISLVRDLFVFQCYTGLSYIDMKNLVKAEIQIGIDGNRWIIKTRTKTNQRSPIPLLPKSIEILEKYNWLEKQDNEPVLPVISNQKLNGYLEEVAQICGITKKITTHVGRRTFATTITLGNGVPMETVSKMLGHTNLRTTQIYAKVVDTKISNDMQILKDKLSTKDEKVAHE